MYKNRTGKHLSFRTIIIGGIIVVLIVFLVTEISVKSNIGVRLYEIHK